MLFAYIAGMFTMFSLLIIKEYLYVPTNTQKYYIDNQTFILMHDEVNFPYETTYLRATMNKYKEHETIVYEIIRNLIYPVCTEKDYQIYLNHSMQMYYNK